jgi:ribosomal protein S18 acetylase RimI-like enzyme
MNYQIDNNYTDEDKARVIAGFAAYAEGHDVPPRVRKAFVYRDGAGLCIACLEMQIAGKQGYIKTLWVDDKHRAQGLAKALMQEAEDFAHSEGFAMLFVDTFAFQAPAFYKKCGFSQIAEVPDYIAGHSRVFLRKMLVVA